MNRRRDQIGRDVFLTCITEGLPYSKAKIIAAWDFYSAKLAFEPFVDPIERGLTSSEVAFLVKGVTEGQIRDTRSFEDFLVKNRARIYA